MARAWARICPGVSSTTPLGGTSTPSHRGSAAWHMEQRDSTTFSTSAKSAPDGSAAVSRRVAGCALSQTMAARSEAHTTELQSLMRTSYAVLCLKTNITEHTIAEEQARQW